MRRGRHAGRQMASGRKDREAEGVTPPDGFISALQRLAFAIDFLQSIFPPKKLFLHNIIHCSTTAWTEASSSCRLSFLAAYARSTHVCLRRVTSPFSRIYLKLIVAILQKRVFDDNISTQWTPLSHTSQCGIKKCYRTEHHSAL